MIKKIVLIFGLLIFCTTSYSDVGQIESINHTQVKNDTEKTAQPTQLDQKESVVVSQEARKRSTGRNIGRIIGIIIGTIVALVVAFVSFISIVIQLNPNPIGF